MTENLKKREHSFCVHPWMNLLVNNWGTYQFCCITDRHSITGEDGKVLYAGQGDMPEEAWNAKSLRDVRKAMLDGEKLDICKSCWNQESVGKESFRHRHNREWEQRLGKEEIERRVEYSLKNDYTVDVNPDYLDLRLGNICNLKCRMCNLYNSNQIEKEHHELKTNIVYADIWKRESKSGSNINVPSLKNDWVETDKLWEQLSSYIPGLKKVYFTGGEPTLVENNYGFMQEIIKAGYQDRIDIMFNTNCTNVQPRFIKLLSQFKHVQINASIDGTGSVNDYIRPPSTWKSIRNNFIKIAKLPNVRVNISPVIMIYNILNITDILDLAEEVSVMCDKIIDVDFLYCERPLCLDPMNLDEDIRTAAFIALWRARDTWLYENSSITRNNVEAYLTMLEGNRNENWRQGMEDFWNLTEIWDTKRKQSFKDSVPALYKMLRGQE